MNQHILFVFEGEKTEKIYSTNFIQKVLPDHLKSVITTSFRAEIYQLYKIIAQDPLSADYVDW